MRDLNRDLYHLQRRSGDGGSHASRRDRRYALAQMANTLHELGHRGLRANGLKGNTSRRWSTTGATGACPTPR